MPNKRADGSKMLSFWAEPDLFSAIERGRRRVRGMHRSQFIRDAIAEKLKAMEIEFKEGAELAPDRMGKGGRKKTVYKLGVQGGWSQNESPQPKVEE